MNDEKEEDMQSQGKEPEITVVPRQLLSSFFDTGKARQTVYSILMGFVLKYFIEHTFELKSAIISLDTGHLFAYICILSYFFLNCFRYLFGLVDYANMADEKFAPQKGDWKRKNFFANLAKEFVINTGVFQLIIFSFSVFLLFPKIEVTAETTTASMAGALTLEMPGVICGFAISNLLLLFIDVLSLYLYRRHVRNKDFDSEERVQFMIWRFSSLVEFGLGSLLLGSIMVTMPESCTTFQQVFLLLLTFLAIIETLSIYKYFEAPLQWLIKLLESLRETWRKFSESQ